jgi:hypothetical protein
MYQRGYDILEHPLMGSSSMEYNNVFCESFYQTASQMTCSFLLWESVSNIHLALNFIHFGGSLIVTSAGISRDRKSNPS